MMSLMRKDEKHDEWMTEKRKKEGDRKTERLTLAFLSDGSTAREADFSITLDV